jgi:hypothetical protein
MRLFQNPFSLLGRFIDGAISGVLRLDQSTTKGPLGGLIAGRDGRECSFLAQLGKLMGKRRHVFVELGDVLVNLLGVIDASLGHPPSLWSTDP